MNKQQTEQLKELYRKHGANQLINEFIYKGEDLGEPAILIERFNKIQDHVQATYNCEELAFTFSNTQSNRVKSFEYFMDGNRHPLTGRKTILILTKGKANDFFHLISALHEVGHGIDFSKKDFKEFCRRDYVATMDKEIKAWIYGLRFGYLTGLVTKEEIDKTWVRSMLCLATYCKYYDNSVTTFIRVAEEIYQKVFE